ncbi:hypothetical protein QBC36DRAFT_181162 [Triangularia setosa]|uniref:Uncharacterized protein n=1 Tax=Triangularia setosa TaxID=2587417 RepID=A0AAN6WF87_9PEZI|nr:hypothetical protein QBC36DRAFT_181162 [Podospora setosa]
MTRSSPLTIIPSSSLRILASLLHLPQDMTDDGMGELLPPAKWLAQQKQAVESAGVLPPEVLLSSCQTQHLWPRRKLGRGLVRRAVVITPLLAPLLTGGGHGAEGKGKGEEGLCEAHGGLNCDLIREVYYLVKKEVIAHGEAVRSWLRHICRHEQKFKSQEWGDVRGFVEDMVGIVTLMEVFEPGNGEDEERWEGYFGRGLDVDALRKKGRCFERVENGCMACVLGIIGGRKRLVIGLRASCLGRARRRTPRLLGRWLPGWVERFGGLERGEIETKSEELAGRIRVVGGLQRERFRGREGEGVSSRLARLGEGLGMGDAAAPEVPDHGQEEDDAERGEQQSEDDGKARGGSNNPYHQASPDNGSASPLVPPQPGSPQSGPFGGFDGALDDDEDYRRIVDNIIPDRYLIHSPMPMRPASLLSDSIINDKRGGYIHPRQSWTAFPPPLFSLRYPQPPLHRPGNPIIAGYGHDYRRPNQANPITPPSSTSESHYADEIYGHYHTGDIENKKTGAKTEASTGFAGRPRPEEYDGLLRDKEGLLSPRYYSSPSQRQQHQRRLDDCYSEKSMKGRLKRRLEGRPRSQISSSGRTQWVDFF